jgi:hypothetical protein
VSSHPCSDLFQIALNRLPSVCAAMFSCPTVSLAGHGGIYVLGPPPLEAPNSANMIYRYRARPMGYRMGPIQIVWTSVRK